MIQLLFLKSTEHITAVFLQTPSLLNAATNCSFHLPHTAADLRGLSRLSPPPSFALLVPQLYEAIYGELMSITVIKFVGPERQPRQL